MVWNIFINEDDTIRIAPTDTVQLTYRFEPKEPRKKQFMWVSDDTTKVKVKKTGEVYWQSSGLGDTVKVRIVREPKSKSTQDSAVIILR